MDHLPHPQVRKLQALTGAWSWAVTYVTSAGDPDMRWFHGPNGWRRAMRFALRKSSAQHVWQA